MFKTFQTELFWAGIFFSGLILLVMLLVAYDMGEKS